MEIPLKIPTMDAFSDQELVAFCLANPDLRVERDENGLLYIHLIPYVSPTHLLTSSNNSELNTEIGLWNRRTKAGKVIDSNGGFFLNDKSMKAPDVAWIHRDRWEALSKSEKHSFPYLAPDFIIELQSDSDNLDNLKHKMEKWILNGVRLGWLVAPSERQTYIYRQNGTVETKPFAEKLYGEDVLEGFETVLADILEF
ncbi:MAG: Uma2 family endonuclease [Runella sp.]